MAEGSGTYGRCCVDLWQPALRCAPLYSRMVCQAHIPIFDTVWAMSGGRRPGTHTVTPTVCPPTRPGHASPDRPKLSTRPDRMGASAILVGGNSGKHIFKCACLLVLPVVCSGSALPDKVRTVFEAFVQDRRWPIGKDVWGGSGVAVFFLRHSQACVAGRPRTVLRVPPVGIQTPHGHHGWGISRISFPWLYKEDRNF
eukprot:gene14768-biopygen12657